MEKSQSIETNWQQERLNRWIENGYGPEAVAIYGTTTAILKDISQTGLIPSIAPENPLEYQRELIGKSNHLYYFYPVLKNLARFNPSLAERIHNHSKSQQIQTSTRFQITEAGLLTFPAPPNGLTLWEAQEDAKVYAINKSVNDIFTKLTGIKAELEDILAVTMKLWPDKYQQFLKKCPYKLYSPRNIQAESSPLTVKSIVAHLNKNPQIFPDWLESQGALIYFNPDLFELGKLKLGIEDEDEIMLLSKEKLPANIISGVEALSNKDRQELLKAS